MGVTHCRVRRLQAAEVATAHTLPSLGSPAPSVGSLALYWDVDFPG